MKQAFLLSILLTAFAAFPQVKLADSLFFAQNFKASKTEYEKNKTEVEASPLLTNRLGYCYHKTGHPKEAIVLYLKAEAAAASPMLKNTVQSRLARAYALQGNATESLRWLNMAVSNGYSNIKELDEERDYTSVRNKPRFKALRDSVFALRNPCFANPQNREFDFWIGEWNVTSSGIPVGHSVVQIASGGCMILENWTASDGSNGKSMNYIDPATGKWEQTWSGSGGNVTKFVNGIYDGKQMLFEHTSIVNGVKQTGRFHFYDLGNDRVRQMDELSADDGKTWTTLYDFIYTRVK